MRRSRLPVLAILAFLALLTSGCFRGFAEDSVRKSLPKIIGPAAKYEVHIENTSDGQLMAGKIQDLLIVGYRVKTKDGLVLDRLTVRMHKLEVDTKKKAIKSVERATFDIDVKQEDLSAMARQRVHNLGSPVVLLGANKVDVVMPAKVLKASVDTVVRGMLAVEDGQRILFIADKMTIGPVPVPDLMVTAAVGRINPLADLRSLPVPVQVDSLTTDAGLLNVKGRLYVAPGASAADPNPSPSATPTPTPTPTPSPTPTPTATPLPSPSAAPRATPSASPSSAPSSWYWPPGAPRQRP